MTKQKMKYWWNKFLNKIFLKFQREVLAGIRFLETFVLYLRVCFCMNFGAKIRYCTTTAAVELSKENQQSNS
jgi:hypothetical protein